MTQQEKVFQNFTDALWTANDEVALRNVAERVAAGLGFKWFAYLGIHEAQTVWLSNYPREWIERYFEQGYEHIDPVVKQARQQRNAFAWTGEGQQKLRGTPLNRFFAEARDFDIGSGLTVPIRSGFGRTTALTFSTDAKGVEAEKTVTSPTELVELIGLYFHARVEAQIRTAVGFPDHTLSQREAECLGWAARGKTMAETAAIVGLTPRTISFHLENARQKLDASNVTQAVAMALRRGLIS